MGRRVRVFLKGFDCGDSLGGGGFAGGERENCRAEIPLVINGAEGLGDGTEVGVAETSGAAVGVGEVDVPDGGAGEAYPGGHVLFLDVHVEEIEEEADVLGFEGGKE